MSESSNPFEQPKSEPISTSLPQVPESSFVPQQEGNLSQGHAWQKPSVEQSTVYTGVLPVSGMGIAAFVCALLALFGVWIPVINFISLILALVAIILGILGIVSVSKGKKSGKGWGIAGVVLGGVAIVLSIVLTVFYVKVGSEIMNDPDFQKAVLETEQQQDLDSSDPDASEDFLNDTSDAPITENLAIGESATTEDGLKVTVTAVEPITDQYEGDLLKVTVSYENTGKGRENFDSYDWGSINGSGIYTGTKYASSTIENELQSGALTPGSKTSGVVVLAGDAATITYDGDFDEDPEISWKVK